MQCKCSALYGSFVRLTGIRIVLLILNGSLLTYFNCFTSLVSHFVEEYLNKCKCKYALFGIYSGALHLSISTFGGCGATRMRGLFSISDHMIK